MVNCSCTFRGMRRFNRQSWVSYLEGEVLSMFSFQFQVNSQVAEGRKIMLQIVPSALVHICVPSSSLWCSVPWSTETRRSRRSSLSTWRLRPQAATRPSASLTLRRNFHFCLSSLSFLSRWAGWNWPVRLAEARWSQRDGWEQTATHSCGEVFTLTAQGGWTSSPA